MDALKEMAKPMTPTGFYTPEQIALALDFVKMMAQKVGAPLQAVTVKSCVHDALKAAANGELPLMPIAAPGEEGKP